MLDIDKLEAGPELNTAVAEKVMGWPRYKPEEKDWGNRPYIGEFPDGATNVYAPENNYWSPGTDIAAAWEVMRAIQFRDRDIQDRFLRLLDAFVAEEHGGGYPGTRWTLLLLTPLAICQAALKTVLEHEQKTGG